LFPLIIRPDQNVGANSKITCKVNLMIEIGASFENEIAQLLRLTTFEVQREISIGFKKVDLYLSERRLGSTRRIAVECKAYKKRLDQAEVSTIYSNYRPLCESNLIDEVLIVTKNGLTPSALAMVEATRDLSHMTSSDIFDLIMNFGPYLNGLERQFDESGLSSYYIPPQISEDRGFEEEILNWISLPLARPLAILGSYGTGKTTLAKRMASVLASRAKTDRECRIPILVRLGEISSEQSLEGLLGKLFTAHSVVRNYTFDVFMALNGMGRFVIFLDGFDEMKHTLSWAEFKYNFRQLNRLVVPNSKVVILGRPTAFLSDEEYRYALRGLRLVADVELREPDWPEYEEFQLMPFSPQQSRLFLQKYLAYKARVARDPVNGEVDLAAEKLDKVFQGEFSDLWRRPVQLKMLAEVLPSWKGELEGLTVVKLYSYFIDLMIEREQEKLARRRFDLNSRRSFARDLAMFLWRSKGEMSITAESIPLSLVKEYCDPEDDVEAVRRDLVSACFLDRKFGDSLFFPHRSFQEFLVAEALIRQLTVGTTKFPDASALANEEVVEFMKGMITLDTLREWEDRFNRATGLISPTFASLWLAPENVLRFLWTRFESTNSPWYPALLTLAAHSGLLERERKSDLIDSVIRKLEGPIGRYALACLWCVLQLGERDSIGRALRKMTKVERYRPDKSKGAGFIPEAAVVELFSYLIVEGPSKRLHIVEAAYGHLVDVLSDYCLIGERTEKGMAVVFQVDLPERLSLSGEDIAAIQEFQFKYCGKRIKKLRR